MESVIVIAGLLFVIAFVRSLLHLGISKPKTPPSSFAQSITPIAPPMQSATDSIPPMKSITLTTPLIRLTTNNSGILELLPHQFVVLDLETTGLDSSKDEIIEFGAIKVNLESDNHTTFQILVKPERKIPKKITEITGITQTMVESDGLEPRDAFAQFIEFIGDLPLVTYNAEFDMGFLYNSAKKHGVEINNRYACALKRARRAWPGLPSYRLTYLAKIAKLPEDNTHRALGDCKRALIIFTSATSELRQKVRWLKPPIEFGVSTKWGQS